MRTSPLRRAVAWTLPAALVVSSVAVVATSATASPGTAPTVTAQAADGGDTIVGLGDSYMSGEGVMYANHNFPGNKPSSSSSNWQTGAGALGGDPGPNGGDANAVGNTWRSVFGDANGYPDKGGKETIPYCDRSYAAAMHIGEGWNSVNLACSGAISTTVPVAPKTGYFKPGIDFYPRGVTNPPVQGLGQAQMLQDLAEQNTDIKVVALSIGGNDFGFSQLGSDCIIDNQKYVGFGPSDYSRCEKQTDTLQLVKDGLPKARAAVTKSITNIAEAMAAAGYEENEWRLVYQPPPLPIQSGAQTKYNDAGGVLSDRNSVGGCGLWNSTIDWIISDVYQPLVARMALGVADARESLGATPVTLLDTSKTFQDHGLCGKATEGATNYPTGQAGKMPPFRDDNGRKTEWVTYVARLEQLSGNGYQKSMPLHPNYWGQRALSACMTLATEAVGATEFSCNQDGERLDEEGRPAMKAVDAAPLWILAVGKPVVTGAPEVGATLTADPTDAFEPATGLAYDYQWFADGVEISGATEQTLVVPAGTVGQKITVRVTASQPGLDSDSATSEPVQVSDLDNIDPPTIAGQAKVGVELTADPGTYAPTPDSFTYQWLADGEPVEGATNQTFTPGSDQFGKRLAVLVAAAKTGYTSMIIGTDETEPVAAGAMVVSGKPSISGGTKPGQVLTASIAGLTFTPTPDRVSYKWYRDGQLVTGITGPDYEVTGDDVGSRITVVVDAHATGFDDASSPASDPTDVITRQAIERLKDPTVKYFSEVQSLRKIKGNKAKVGRELQADLTGVFSIWPNSPKVQWYRKKDGKKSVISTGDLRYRPTPDDVGHKIWAVITTDEQGYDQASATTQKVTVVRATRVVFTGPLVGTKNGKRPRVGSPVFATKARFVPPTAATYHWYAGGKRIKGATGRKYVPTTRVAGERLWVVAKAPRTEAFKASSVRSNKTKRVKAVKGLG